MTQGNYIYIMLKIKEGVVVVLVRDNYFFEN